MGDLPRVIFPIYERKGSAGLYPKFESLVGLFDCGEPRYHLGDAYIGQNFLTNDNYGMGSTIGVIHPDHVHHHGWLRKGENDEKNLTTFYLWTNLSGPLPTILYLIGYALMLVMIWIACGFSWLTWNHVWDGRSCWLLAQTFFLAFLSALIATTSSYLHLPVSRNTKKPFYHSNNILMVAPDVLWLVLALILYPTKLHLLDRSI